MALQSAFQGVQRIFRELDKHRSYHEKKLTEMSSDEVLLICLFNYILEIDKLGLI